MKDTMVAIFTAGKKEEKKHQHKNEKKKALRNLKVL